jgi:hypothetical protein
LPATDPSNQNNVNTELSVFICPSTSNYTPVVRDIAQRDPIVKVGTAARSDYEAIGGIHFDPEWGGFGGRLYDFIRPGIWASPQYDDSDDGTYSHLYRTAFRDVTDGLSNTMMVGEMAGRPDIYRRGEPELPYEGNEGAYGSPAWAISGIFHALALAERNGVNDTNHRGLYSFHAVGANICLADGSVRMLSADTDRKILHALATRAGGEVVAQE